MIYLFSVDMGSHVDNYHFFYDKITAEIYRKTINAYSTRTDIIRDVNYSLSRFRTNLHYVHESLPIENLVIYQKNEFVPALFEKHILLEIINNI